MSEVVGEAVLNVVLDGSGADQQAAALGKSTGDKVSGGFKNSVKGLGGSLALALGGAAAGAAAGAFFKGAITGASDLSETVSKTNVVFGDTSKKVIEFSKAGAGAFGQTQQEVLDAASTFGTLGKAAGLSGGDLSKFSTDFVGLSSDLASFNNTSPEEAVQAIGSALRGEAEPIRKFGVLLDDATLKNEALKLGLIKTTTEALTPQQKTLAAQSAIMKQTADAQGDFERTSGGLANQQKILSATFGDLQTKIGGLFLPVVTKVVSVMVDLLTTISGGGGAFSGIGAAIGSFASQIGTVLQPLLATMAATFTGSILPAITALAGFVITNLVPVLQQLGAIIIGQILPTFVAIGVFIYGTLYPAFISIVTAVAQNLAPVLVALAGVFRDTILPAVSALVTQFREELLPALLPIIEKVVAVAGFILKLASAILGFLLPPLIQVAAFIIGKVVPVIADMIVAVVKVIGFILNLGEALINAGKTVGEFAGKVIGLYKDGFNLLIDGVRELPGRIMDLGGKFLEAGKSIIGSFIDGLKGAGGLVSDIAGNVWDAVRGLLNDAIGKINAALSFTINLPGPDITINPPDIPRLARGIVTNRPLLGVFGESGPEAAVPLTPGAPLAPGVLDAMDVFARQRGLGGSAPSIGQVIVQLPTGDPEAAALAVVDRLAAEGFTG